MTWLMYVAELIVLFGFFFRRVSANGFLLCYVVEGFEFEDQLKPGVLHAEAVSMCDGNESIFVQVWRWDGDRYPSSVSMYHGYLDPNMMAYWICFEKEAYSHLELAPSASSKGE